MPLTPPPIANTARGASPINQYFENARIGRHHWWHWLLGFAFIMVFYMAVVLAMFIVIYAVSDALSARGNASVTTLELIEYLALAVSFLPLFVAVFLFQKVWHKRAALSLLTYATKFRWGHLIRAMITISLVYALTMPIMYIFDPEEIKSLKFIGDWKLFATGLIITLVFIPFQAAAEEIAIRGYLNQALIKYVKFPIIAFLVTSLLFASLHLSNPEAAGQKMAYMLSIGGFGMLMCVLLYFEGGLESAIGMHIANNIFAFSIVGYEDPELPELALWTAGPPEITLGASLIDLATIGVAVMVVLFWNRRASKHTLVDQSAL